MHLAILAYDGFTDIDVFLPWDLLNRVETRPWRVEILADTSHVTSISGLTIPAHGSLSRLADADAVLVTSGPGLRRKLDDPHFLSALALDPKRQLIGSMCSGALLLAKLGFLTGKRATTYPTRRVELASMGVQVVEEPFVREGNIATAAGCLAGVELSGWFIETLAGAKQREMVLRSVQPVGRGLSFNDSQSLPSRQYSPPQ